MIDKTDFSVLKTIQTSDTPLWKKEIHRQILDGIDSLPYLDSVSIQTIGRRVEQLYDDRYLKAKLTQTDEVNRTLITTYHLTEQGQQAIEDYREKLLRDWVVTNLTSHLNGSSGPDACLTAITEVFCSHFGIRDDQIEPVSEQQLLAALTDYFLDQELPAADSDQLQHLLDTLDASPQSGQVATSSNT
ncbi:MAG: hypothetical protein SV186_02315 [Candidatus Nanohaloarchaea archaeon]|nr:hypothetical protein [Candidatus Nanohaloarchaea archaeon]